MADGSFSARSRLAADAPTALYTVPANSSATANINLVNVGQDNAKVGIAITSGGVPADGDWIEIDVTLAKGQALLRTNEPLAAGEIVYVTTNQATVDVRISGYQEDL